MKIPSFAAAVEKYQPMEFKDESALRDAITKGGGDTSGVDALLPPAKTPEPAKTPATPKRNTTLNVADKRPATPKPKYKNNDGSLKSTKDAEKVNKRFGDAVAEASKKVTPRSKTKLDAQIKTAEDQRDGAPPIETLEDYNRQSPTMSGLEHASQLQHIGEQSVGQDSMNSHLESAGVFEATPQQIKQFAQMLDIDVWGAISTPQQLRAAIEVHNKHDDLYAILRKNGLMSREAEEKPSSMQKTGKAVGDFVSGLESNLPTGIARRAARAGIGMLNKGRFQATEEQSYGAKEVARIKHQTQKPHTYAAEYPLAPDDDLWAGRQWKEQGATRSDMTPDEYLGQVRPLDMDDETQETIAALVNHMKTGGNLDPLWIHGERQPNGFRKEDGRHRAHAAKQMGMSSVPVLTWPEQNAEAQTGIVMPTDDVSNDDANEGDQLGLFGEGKKKKVPKQYKQENPQGKARAKTLFDKDEDPDQQTLFSSFGEAVSYYAANEKKK